MEEGKDPQVRIPNASFPLPRKKTDAEKPRLFFVVCCARNA